MRDALAKQLRPMLNPAGNQLSSGAKLAFTIAGSAIAVALLIELSRAIARRKGMTT